MITGVHHVCVKCRPEELEKIQKFYGELLGLSLVRSWGEPKVEGMMYGAGTSLIEIFPNAEEDLPQGAIRHFALATDDVDSIVETVRKAGYAVTMAPVDIEIMSKPSLPARIAFIIGPVGEEIELFYCTGGAAVCHPAGSKTPRAAQNSPSPRAGIRSCFPDIRKYLLRHSRSYG